MGRSEKYHTDEERKQARNKSWMNYYYRNKYYCPVCNKEFSFSSKYKHPQSQAHLNNLDKKLTIQKS